MPAAAQTKFPLASPHPLSSTKQPRDLLLIGDHHIQPTRHDIIGNLLPRPDDAQFTDQIMLGQTREIFAHHACQSLGPAKIGLRRQHFRNRTNTAIAAPTAARQNCQNRKNAAKARGDISGQDNLPYNNSAGILPASPHPLQQPNRRQGKTTRIPSFPALIFRRQYRSLAQIHFGGISCAPVPPLPSPLANPLL